MAVMSKDSSCKSSVSLGGWDSGLLSPVSAWVMSGPLGSNLAAFSTMPPIALAAADLVSQVFDLRKGRTLVSKLKSSSGCCFWTSPSCWAAVFRMRGVLPVSSNLYVGLVHVDGSGLLPDAER